MRTEEQLTVATPEDIDITLTLAGIGSRFVAAFIDLLVQIGIIYVTILAVGFAFGSLLASDVGLGVLAAISISVVFVVFFLYHLILEAIWNGKTLGKAAMGIYVVRDGGMPLSPGASAIRNILRIVDFLPVFYLVGLIAIIANPGRKRLGDFVAATIVVKKPQPEPGTGAIRLLHALPPQLASWDVAAISDDEELLVRRFLARRRALLPAQRERLAYTLAAQMAPKVIGNTDGLAPEVLLEAIALRTSWRSAPASYTWGAAPGGHVYPPEPAHQGLQTQYAGPA